VIKRISATLLTGLLAAPALAAPEEDGGAGLPQFDFERIAASQVFWLLLTFGLLYLLMLAMLPRISGVVEKRASTIGGDLDAADQARLEAEEKREAYENGIAKTRSEAQALIGAAKADAARANEARMAEAEKAAQARMDEANAELAVQREAALARLDEIAGNATQDIVEKLTGRRPSDAEASSAVAAART
jgi:F-type H+-transporting ATPase subunit b